MADLLNEFGEYLKNSAISLHNPRHRSVVVLVSALIITNTHVDDWYGTPLCETILHVYAPTRGGSARFETDSVILAFINDSCIFSPSCARILSFEFIQEFMMDTEFSEGDAALNRRIEMGGMLWLNNNSMVTTNENGAVSHTAYCPPLPILLYKTTSALELMEATGK